MLSVGAKDFRLNLTRYLDLIEHGEEITIIRNSSIIGRLVPNEAFVNPSYTVDNSYAMTTNREVSFRRFGQFEDPEAIIKLHREALEQVGAYTDDPHLDEDLSSPSMFYDNMDGEFWVGVLDEQIVTMGGFFLNLASGTGEKQAILKRMRVKPELQGQGIGTKMLELLEKRMKMRGYGSIILDVTDKQDQASARHLYEKFGYVEFKRQPAENFTDIFYKKSL